MTQQWTGHTQDASHGGPAVVLWLFAALVAEIELFLWLFERWYS